MIQCVFLQNIPLVLGWSKPVLFADEELGTLMHGWVCGITGKVSATLTDLNEFVCSEFSMH